MWQHKAEAVAPVADCSGVLGFERYKARLVAKEFKTNLQIYSLETFFQLQR